MRSGRKLLLIAGALATGLLVSGCGGVNATGSVSPATFLLPGIMYRTPQAKPLDTVRDPEVARNGNHPFADVAGQP